MKKTFNILLVIVGLMVIFAVVNKFKASEIDYNQVYIDDYNIYGESLNISVNGSFENTLYFEDVETKDIVELQTSSEIDKGVDPMALEEGEYYILLDNDESSSALASFEQIEEEYYTITRDNINYLITFETDDSGYLVYSKEQAQLPSDVYDIIIDPGHGGDDIGAIGADEITTEAAINLYVSLLLYDVLDEMGYKVAITRESDINPGNCEGVDKYCEGGRVDQVYETNAKISISIHHNTGGNSGFEIYDSTFSSHELSEFIVSNLQEVADVSGKETSKIAEGMYNEVIEGEGIDYYYMIREVGGVATQGYNEDNSENNQSKIGAQGILLELGYIDNYEDLYTLVDDDYQAQEVEMIATAIDEYINS